MDQDQSMDIDSTGTSISAQQKSKKQQPTILTRLCDTPSENYYIYLTIEMELQADAAVTNTSKRKPSFIQKLSIMIFRKMLSNATQDLFGAAMGGGINIDILGYWTDQAQDPFNRMISSASSSSSSDPISSPTLPTVSVRPTYSNMTAASAVLRCHSLDFNQLWNALTLFNTLVDDYESRFEVHYTSSTLLGLQANSRQLLWPN
ncbi:hypothetical protein BX616_002516 [Lobosporangium transversale]|nr:hypothetical protein BX616_002516 [Lobosporangium transversale]